MAGSFYFMFNRTVFSCDMLTEASQFKENLHESEHGYKLQNKFSIIYSDYYYLDLELNNDYPADVAIINADGKAVYQFSGDYLKMEQKRLTLKKGEYCIGISISADIGEHALMNIKYAIK